jgi:hypothetical protein
MKRSLFVLGFCLLGLCASAQEPNVPQNKEKTRVEIPQKTNRRAMKMSKAKGCKPGKTCKKMTRKWTKGKCTQSSMKKTATPSKPLAAPKK